MNTDTSVDAVGAALHDARTALARYDVRSGREGEPRRQEVHAALVALAHAADHVLDAWETAWPQDQAAAGGRPLRVVVRQ